MARTTICDGVYFCEGVLEGDIIGTLEVSAATQNTILSAVKTEMARRARAMGGNAVINFCYTQAADRGRNLFKWDQERLNLKGLVIKLTQDVTLT